MKRRQTRPSLGHRSPQLRMDQASPITPLAFYRGKSPKKLNGYIFVVKRARAGPGPGPARPGPQWGYPPRGSEGSRSRHCHKLRSTSSVRRTVHLKMSGVCDSAVDGNIEIPSGGTPQDVHVFNMAGPLEKSNEPILPATEGQGERGRYRLGCTRQGEVW